MTALVTVEAPSETTEAAQSGLIVCRALTVDTGLESAFPCACGNGNGTFEVWDERRDRMQWEPHFLGLRCRGCVPRNAAVGEPHLLD